MIAHKKYIVRVNLQDITVYGSKFSQEPVALRTTYMGILSPSKVCAISRRSEPFLFKSIIESIHLFCLDDARVHVYTGKQKCCQGDENVF